MHVSMASSQSVLEEVGFDVDQTARWEERFEHALELDVRHRLEDVEKRLSETAQWLQNLFSPFSGRHGKCRQSRKPGRGPET